MAEMFIVTLEMVKKIIIRNFQSHKLELISFAALKVNLKNNADKSRGKVQQIVQIDEYVIFAYFLEKLTENFHQLYELL